MTFAPFKAGSYIIGERLLSAQVNQLNTDIPFALDGRDGGLYEPTERVRVGGAGLGTGAVIAWLSLDNNTTAAAARLDILLKSSYYRAGSWTTSGTPADLIEVPEPGLYEIDFRAWMNGTGLTASLIEVLIQVDGATVGWARGFLPDRTLGWALVPILDPPNELISFSPTNCSNQTPLTEGSVGQLHQIKIQKVGELF